MHNIWLVSLEVQNNLLTQRKEKDRESGEGE